MIERKINDIELLVNTNASNEIYFDSEFLSLNGLLGKSMTPSELCGLISGKSYTPMILTWELLDKCNFSCPFCYIVGHSNHRIVRFENTKNEIQHLIDLGMLYCTLTGGEAMLHKDFKEIYVFLKQSGVIVEVYSNGHLIDNSIIEIFKELPPYRIEISIYGVDQLTFDKATGTKGNNYKKVLENVLKLKKEGINVKCKTPFNSLTESGFDKIGDWCNSNGIDYYYSTSIYNAYDGENLHRYQSGFSNMIDYEAKKIIEIENEFPGTFDLKKRTTVKKCYTCGVRNYGLHINSNFELLPCSETHTKECAFDIFSLGLDECISRNRQFVNTFMDKPISGCIGCEASSTCKMCTAIAIPQYDINNNIEEFTLPEGHCDFERKKYNAILNELSK